MCRPMEHADLVPARSATPGMKALASTGPVPMMFGSFILLWWGIMLVFQGEGLELDIQRRRHPLWEWIFSHPVPPGAFFLAEILTPIAANPVYWTSPLFAGLVYGAVYGPLPGVLAVLLAGVPITVAAACLGKAIEIGVILRFSSRTRGAMIGLMSWIGYSTLMLFFVGIVRRFQSHPSHRQNFSLRLPRSCHLFCASFWAGHGLCCGACNVQRAPARAARLFFLRRRSHLLACFAA